MIVSRWTDRTLHRGHRHPVDCMASATAYSKGTGSRLAVLRTLLVPQAACRVSPLSRSGLHSRASLAGVAEVITSTLSSCSGAVPNTCLPAQSRGQSGTHCLVWPDPRTTAGTQQRLC